MGAAQLIGRTARCPKCGKKFPVSGPPPDRFDIPQEEPQVASPSEWSPTPEWSPPDQDVDKHTAKARWTRQQVFMAATLAVLVVLLVFNRAFGLATGFLFLSSLAFFYFIPSMIASVRRHKNTMSIFIVNLFLGWTFLAWVVCIAWAFSSHVRESRHFVKQVNIKGDTSGED